MAALVVAGALAAPAMSTAAGWVPVTGATGLIAWVGQVQTPDGVLHVVWSRSNAGTGTQDILTTTIDESSATPTVPPPRVIASAFSGAGNPAIVLLPDNVLEVFFGGIQCTDPGCASGLFASTSTDGGQQWSVPRSLFDTDQAFASDVNAATLSDGTPFETWWHTTGTSVHRGVDGATPTYDYQGAMGAGCCGYYSNLAADASGHMELAWDSNDSAFQGVWAQAVDPATGAPSGTSQLMPGSVTMFNGSPEHAQMPSRTPIVAVPGQSGVFYVAYPQGYPTTTRVALWRVGDPTTTAVVDDQQYHLAASVAADSIGRVWVFWSTIDNGVGHVFARRLGANGLEAPVDLGAPLDQTVIYGIDGSVTRDGDPVALARVALNDGTSGTYYTRGPQTAPPQNGRSVGAAPVSGKVLYKPPGSKVFVELTAGEQIPVGSTIDVTHGRIRLTAAKARGGTSTADFSAGKFVIKQHRGSSLADLRLTGGKFGACRTRSGRASAVAVAAKHHRVRGLKGSGKGQFRTKGKYAAATVRGTTWTTDDYCDGTAVGVQRGVVRVTDFVRHRTVNVRAPHRYFAAAPGR